jgi:hypothetical protein
MDPSVKAAWISSSVALAVAVVGVIATGVAQWRGSKTAHANALALFKQQAEEQAAVRAVEAEKQRRAAFLAERKQAYAKLLLVAALYDYDQKVMSSLRPEESAAHQRAQEGKQLDGDSAVLAKSQEVKANIKRGTAELYMAQETVKLLAPRPVRDAAMKWIDAVFYRRTAAGLDTEFLRVARIDVGSDPAEQGEAPS